MKRLLIVLVKVKDLSEGTRVLVLREGQTPHVTMLRNITLRTILAAHVLTTLEVTVDCEH